MTRKKTASISIDLDNRSFHVEEKIWCDRDERQETILVCLYRCPDKATCSAYAKKYDFILDMEIPEKYLLKYGTPERPVPTALIKKQKREAKQAKEQVKIDKQKAKEKKIAEKEAKAKETAKKKKQTAKKTTAVKPAAKQTTSKTKTSTTDLTNW